MEKSTTLQNSPYKVKVEKDKIYFWCSCGLSKKQPFCDSSHKKLGKYNPVKYLAKSDKVVFFCGCKLTKHSPFCDNSHINIKS